MRRGGILKVSIPFRGNFNYNFYYNSYLLLTSPDAFALCQANLGILANQPNHCQVFFRTIILFQVERPYLSTCVIIDF